MVVELAGDARGLEGLEHGAGVDDAGRRCEDRLRLAFDPYGDARREGRLREHEHAGEGDKGCRETAGHRISFREGFGCDGGRQVF